MATDRERWDAVYRSHGPDPGAPSPALTSALLLLPNAGRALDLAGGSGRHALWLAAARFDVTLADVSPVALQRARDAAAARELALSTVEIDLEAQGPPAGPWDVVVCVDFLWRPLLAGLAGLLADEGRAVVALATASNLEKHPRPGPRHLLADRELPAILPGLELLRYDEGWQENGRHEARAVARRAKSGASSLYQ